MYTKSKTIHLKDAATATGVRCKTKRWGISIPQDGNTKLVTCRLCLGLKRAPKPSMSTAGMDLIGKILYTSWGYDMTINDYCKVIAVTPKGVKCLMIGASVTSDNGRGSGSSVPDPSIITNPAPFMLRMKSNGDTMSFTGSYPFCNNSKRKGYFSITDAGKGHYYNSWD